MLRYIVRRILISIIVVWLVSVVVFCMVHALPGDPVQIILGDEATAETIAMYREKLHLNEPLVKQYFMWLQDLLRGDLGNSLITNKPIGQLLLEKVPRTVSIGLPALLIASVLGIFFGIVSVVKRGSWIDQAITFFTTVGIGTPHFWVGILAIYIFSIHWKVLPVGGYASLSESPRDWAIHLVMPVICLALGLTAQITRYTRSNMLEVINQDYIRTARSCGISERTILYKYALRNALIPVVAEIGLLVRVIIGGSVTVEQVANIAGIGQMMVSSVNNRDYTMIQDGVLVISLFVVICNLMVDIAYGLIDPRIRKQRGI